MSFGVDIYINRRRCQVPLSHASFCPLPPRYSTTTMRLAVIYILSSLLTALAAPTPLLASISTSNINPISLVRRDKGKWIPFNELQASHKIKVQEEKENKSLSRKISSGVEKKPFFTFAVVGSGLLALNTYLVAEAMRQKEDKVLLLKAKKGELPVLIPDPPAVPKKSTKKTGAQQDSQKSSFTTTAKTSNGGEGSERPQSGQAGSSTA
jgi:hypothetical protein